LAALTGLPWRIVADGLTVRVRLTPKASRNRVEGPVELADGGVAIRATVTAAPESGKANAALLRLLAKTWRLPRTALAVTGGATSRLKTVTISGDGPALAGTLRAWCTATDKTAIERESRNERDRS
jgi:hypothetical protein